MVNQELIEDVIYKSKIYRDFCENMSTYLISKEKILELENGDLIYIQSQFLIKINKKKKSLNGKITYVGPSKTLGYIFSDMSEATLKPIKKRGRKK